MKLKTISAAVIVAAATQANALDYGVDVEQGQLRISGATAMDNQVESYIESICLNGDFDLYENPNDSARAYFCTVDASKVDGINANTNILFHKNSGGSTQGVSPVTTGGTTSFLNMDTCTEVSGSDTLWTCSNTLVDLPAQVGVSDVEPELFAIAANGGKTVDLTADLTVEPINIQTFGIVVSPQMRNALQSAQGLSVGSDDVSNMPTLSSALIANIFAGNVSSWNQLKSANGIGLVDEYNAANGGLDYLDTVNVCVRKPGSGTQAQFNAFYLGNACAYRGAGDLSFVGFGTAIDSLGASNKYSGVDVYPVPSQRGRPLPAPWVYHASGSSDMGRCVTGMAKDTTAPRWGIGLQSLEKVKESSSTKGDYRFIAIDGVTPTLENVSAGLYRNWAAASIQWRNDVVTAGTIEGSLARKLADSAKNVADVKNFNDGLKTAMTSGLPAIEDATKADGFANVGSLAFATGATQPSYPFDAANPVAPFNKGLTGPSACAVATMSADVDVTQR